MFAMTLVNDGHGAWRVSQKGRERSPRTPTLAITQRPGRATNDRSRLAATQRILGSSPSLIRRESYTAKNLDQRRAGLDGELPRDC